MNFEDPFANDLSNFRSVAAGLRQGGAASPPTGSGLNPGRGMGGGGALFAPSPAPSTRGLLGGAAAPVLAGAASDVSLFPPSSNPAPVAGRRARATGAPLATPSLTSPFSAAPSSVPPSMQSNAAAASPFFTSPPTPFPPAAAGVASSSSPLAWLDEVDPSPPLQQQQQVLAAPPPLASRRGAQPPVPAAFPPVAPQPSSALPSFLNFDAADGAGGGGGDSTLPPAPGSHAGPTAAAVPSYVSPTPAANAATAVVDTAALEAEKQRKELRDLNATLDALTAEQQRLEDRLDTRQVKEEAELLALETSVMTKANELTEKEEELAAKQRELAQHTAERLAALSSRYKGEKEAQVAEVRALDGARLEKQLLNVRTQCTAVETSVKGLREEAALAVAMEPFSATGVRVAVAAATAEPRDDEASATAEADLGEGEEKSVASASLERGLQKAVELLRSYCDERLQHARSHLVDYVHSETLGAAHAVRRTREQSWADDALAHKALFSQYMVDMTERYMVFYRERASLKQRNIASLQAELRDCAAELRRRAAARLQELLTNVTAKMTLSTERQTTSAEEAKRVLHQRMRTILEADGAAAMAQRKELESRLLTEAQSRRQRLVAEEQALTDQLHRLRRSSEASAREGMGHLMGAATLSGATLAQSLEEEVASLKARVAGRMQGDMATTVSAVRTASSTAHMHAEELLHVVRRSLDAQAAQQHSLSLSHQRCDELRGALLLKLREDVVGQLHQSRCAQHAHQLRIDAQRKMWEAAHRQNLAAACSLLLPVSGSTAGGADAQYTVETYAAPQDVVSVALLDVVRDKVQSRDDARRRLLADRKASSSRCLRLIEDVQERRTAVQTAWEDVWASSQTQQAQHQLTHEAQLAVETARVGVAARQQAVERERKQAGRECKRIAEVTRRLEAEAARCGVDRAELCAPPEVLEATAGSQLAPAGFLRPVDPATMNRLPTASKFTAVHASTNAISSASASASAVGSAPPHPAETPLPSAVSTTVAAVTGAPSTAPPPPPLPPPGGQATPPASTSNHHVSTLDAVDASNATATQPWSSVLLRAERLLSSSNADDAEIAPLPSPEVSAVADGGDGHPSLRRESRSSHTTTTTTTSSSGNHHSGAQRDRNGGSPAVMAAAAAAASTSRSSTHTEEKHRSSSGSCGLEIPPHLMSSTLQDTSETALRDRRARPSSLWQHLHPLPSRGSALGETWSSLEEFRSGTGRSSSALREQPEDGAVEEGVTCSFDDSTNFVELLSCSDSPASSHRAY